MHNKQSAETRQITPVTLVEFKSRASRETFLTQLRSKNLELKNADGQLMKVERAKTAFQMERNQSLYKAEQIIKKSLELELLKIDGKTLVL